MSRISIMAGALALCLTLFFSTLPHTRAYVSAAPAKEVEQQEKSCATCPASSKDNKDNAVNNLTTMGRRTQQMPFLPLQRSIFDGTRVNMVGTSNGSLHFGVYDLKLPGLMPLVFMRVYTSDRAEDRGLGAGWSFAYDDRIRIDGDEAVMSTGVGSEIAFRRDGESRHFILKTPEPGHHQSFEEAADGTLIEYFGEVIRTYRKVGTIYRLALISDINGNTVSISFDDRGNISRVDSVGGRSLRLRWSAGKHRQLLSVTDNTGQRVSFARQGGLLTTVINQAGSPWKYEYAAGRLVAASDPLGRVVLHARYDAQGRAVESGDAVGSHIFEYKEGGRTVVTEPLGLKTTYTHNALGAVTSLVDEQDVKVAVEYNEANRPARTVDSLGNEQKFAAEAAKQGGATIYTYDARGNVLRARTGDPSTSYRVVRNGRGQPVSLRMESGNELTFDYDAAGNQTAVTYPDRARFEKRYDEAGRVTSRRLSSGPSFDYEYDAHGKVARVTDNNGRSQTIERDASGLVTKVTASDGVSVRALRDEAGRITRMLTSDGRSRQYAYDARGAMTYYRNELGQQYRITYDRNGNVENVDETAMGALRYRDGRGDSLSSRERWGGLNFVRAGFNPLPRPNSYSGTCTYRPDRYSPGSICNPYDWSLGYGWSWDYWGYPTLGGIDHHDIPTRLPNESEANCRYRMYRDCDETYDQCMELMLAGTAVFFALCALLTGTALLPKAVCAAIGGLGAWIYWWTQCRDSYNVCVHNAYQICKVPAPSNP